MDFEGGESYYEGLESAIARLEAGGTVCHMEPTNILFLCDLMGTNPIQIKSRIGEKATCYKWEKGIGLLCYYVGAFNGAHYVRGIKTDNPKKYIRALQKLALGNNDGATIEKLLDEIKGTKPVKKVESRIALRIDQETLNKLDHLSVQWSKKNGLTVSRSAYLRHLIHNAKSV